MFKWQDKWFWFRIIGTVGNFHFPLNVCHNNRFSIETQKEKKQGNVISKESWIWQSSCTTLSLIYVDYCSLIHKTNLCSLFSNRNEALLYAFDFSFLITRKKQLILKGRDGNMFKYVRDIHMKTATSQQNHQEQLQKKKFDGQWSPSFVHWFHYKPSLRFPGKVPNGTAVRIERKCRTDCIIELSSSHLKSIIYYYVCL